MQRLLVEKKYSIVVVLFVSLALLLSACGSTSGLQVGDDAPDFSLQTAQGDQISKADYADQPVLLYFHMAMG